MALAALVRGRRGRDGAGGRAIALVLGVLGASLFYGDCADHARDLGAVGGRGPRGRRARAAPTRCCRSAIAILTVLFVGAALRHPPGRAAVRAGHGASGSSCWPCWACRTSSRTRACCAGCRRPTSVSFVADHPFTAFIAMGAVVLAITGAEALYADMGHFGRRPIRVAWFALVFPALIINYLGQARADPRRPGRRSATRSTCSRRAGRGCPLVVLATVRHRHRLAGGDLRRVLGVAAGRAARATCRT